MEKNNMPALRKIFLFFEQLLWKSGEVKKAENQLDDALAAINDGDGEKAFNELSNARFVLMRDKKVYREPLIDAFDNALMGAWGLWRGKKSKEEAAKSVRSAVDKIKNLLKSPRGNTATPPVRVKSARDARLWDMAKFIVKEEYGEVEEGSRRFWELVSGIFTRLKLRLGGTKTETVDKIVEELLTEFGKIPAHRKAKKIISDVREKEREE